jgi:probable O-glycosylation ligase (exosortase A-associated)
MMAGIKTLLGGGGYGIALVGNSSFLYAEGSTLSTLAVSLIPIYIFLLKEAKIVKDYPKFKYVLLIYIACCIMTVIGTQARTGLIALFVFALLYLRTSKINTKTLFLLALIPVLVYTVAPTSWFERMNTINESTTSEKSAVGRLVVWRWTIDYALENPFLGGGFYAHLANAGVLDEYQAEGEVEIKNKGGKAFHNIFFEVLGEAGFGGLILFGGIITHSYLINRRKLKLKSDKLNAEEETWNRPLSFALNNSLLIYCAGGMFIGVAFYPWLYYLYCASISRINIRNTE